MLCNIIIIKTPDKTDALTKNQSGAGGENRTLVTCLEGTYISHYTTPAYLRTSIANIMMIENTYSLCYNIVCSRHGECSSLG